MTDKSDAIKSPSLVEPESTNAETIAATEPANQPVRQRPGAGKTVAVVLGSGGARGYAHIGVLEVLEEQGYEVVAIAGCSMGALIGGMYAAGKLQVYKDWVTGLGQFDLFRLLDFSLSTPGAIRGEKIFAVVNEMLGDLAIEDLPLPYTAVATDLLAHKEVWFQEGPLSRAIRASVAIPSVFTPVMVGGRVLVDGGLLNPLPIIPTIAAHADIILAVNLAGEGDHHIHLPNVSATSEVPLAEPQVDPLEDDNATEDEWLDRLKKRAASWFAWDSSAATDDSSEEEALAQATETDKPVDPGEDSQEAKPVSLKELGIGKFDIMNLTFETMQSALTQYKLAGYPPDVLINVPKHVCKTFDYHKAPELIQLGRQLTVQTLATYRENEASGGLHPVWQSGRR